MWMVWSRESAAVDVAPSARTSGRMPTDTLSTSSRVGARWRYWPAVSRMNATSSSNARGSSEGSGIGVSVVPTSVCPCHGMANITRPSRVWGTMMALRPGRNDRSKTRWTPWLGAIIGAAAGSVRRRTPSAKGPVALMTTRVATRSSRPGLLVDGDDPVEEPVRLLREPGHAHVVEERGALLGRGLDQVDEEPRVVELAVVVDDPAAEPLGLDRRQPFEGLLAGQDLRIAEAVLAGKDVVDLQADAVEGRLPPVVVGDDEGQVADQMRRVLAHEAALLERLHHEGNVALLEVTDAPVHELGAPARGALAEVVLLEQEHVVASRRRVDGDPGAGGAAADDHHVPGVAALRHPVQHFSAVHTCAPASSQPFARPRASCQRPRSRSTSEAAMDGSNRRSACHCLAISSGEAQNPTARPAR